MKVKPETGFIPVCNQNTKTMKKYTITLKHDTGTVKITTVSTTMTSAIKTVLDYENAPFRAIKKVVSKRI